MTVEGAITMDVALDYFLGDESLLNIVMSLGASAYADGAGQLEAFADFLNTASLESIQFQDKNGAWVDANTLGLTLTSVPGQLDNPFLPLFVPELVTATPIPEPSAMVSWAIQLALTAGIAHRRRRGPVATGV